MQFSFNGTSEELSEFLTLKAKETIASKLNLAGSIKESVAKKIKTGDIVGETLVVGGIVTDFRYEFNSPERCVVSLDCGNVQENVLVFETAVLPKNLHVKDYLKCIVHLRQCGSALEPCYQLRVFYESDIIQHIKNKES